MDAVIQQALREDIGTGDLTGNAIIPRNSHCSARVVAKEPGIVAGLAVAEQIFLCLHEKMQFFSKCEDGTSVNTGDLLVHLDGPTHAIIEGERTALNFLQRMSGIATLTRKFVDAISDEFPAIILDTRKTAPGLRALDKWAVALGGGENHRFGLDEAVLIKENHIRIAGGIGSAMELVKRKLGDVAFVEIEVRDLDELTEALHQKADRVMLDNMDLDDIRRAVEITDQRVPLEVSGNVSLENVSEIASTGVNFISVGQLTHSPPALDITLLIEEISTDGL